jgi:hypothetical protein
MTDLRCPIVELRQYTLHPGQRDTLITVFDRELVESQEELGMTVLGQFTDLDNPDRFVWLRGFDTMAARAEALANFYGGPVWRACSSEANATMIDSDNVLLLRPCSASTGFPVPETGRAPAGPVPPPKSVIYATAYYRDRPFDDQFVEFFNRQLWPAVAEAGAEPLAYLQTEYAENTFPALPVRTGEHAFVWFARLTSVPDADAFADRLTGSDYWQRWVWPGLSALTTQPPQRLRLAPTARSLLR